MATVDVKAWIDDRPVGRFQWLILVACFLIVVFDGFDVAVMGFVGPAVMHEFGISKVAFGPVLGVGMIGLAIGSLSAGPVADRLGRRSVLLLGVAGFGLFSVLTAIARSPLELVLLRLLTGIALGAVLPNTSTLLAEYLPERRRALLVTVMITGFTVGSGSGGFVTASLLPGYGWRSVLLMGGLLPLALLPALWFLLPESPRFLVARGAAPDRIARVLRRLGGRFPASATFVLTEDAGPRRTPVGKLLTARYRRRTLSLWITCFALLLVVYLVLGWLPTLLRDGGLPLGTAAMVAGLFQLGGIVGGPAAGWLMGRWEPGRVLGVSCALSGVFILSLGAVSLSSPLLAVLVFAAGTCLNGGMVGLLAFIPGCYPTDCRASGSAWTLGIGRFGAILGSLVGGAVLGLGLAVPLLFLCLAVPTFAAAVAIVAGREARTPSVLVG
ncbi:MFS transporter [Pseudonocardiaceae bacterium YIM PH 21723]|nr:MFS transporter [Pseudonocardiaceae bacterium YIM PH 21723]